MLAKKDNAIHETQGQVSSADARRGRHAGRHRETNAPLSKRIPTSSCSPASGRLGSVGLEREFVRVGEAKMPGPGTHTRGDERNAPLRITTGNVTSFELTKPEIVETTGDGLQGTCCAGRRPLQLKLS